MENEIEQKIEEKSEQQNRQEFLDKTKSKVVHQRRDFFEDCTQVNNYELPLPNTQKKLVLSLHQKNNDKETYLLKLQVGVRSIFVDAKIAFVMAETMRFLTDDIVPDELKPKTNDAQGGVSPA